MASTSVGVDENLGIPGDGKTQPIRVIVADTQAIFRAGLRKIFALEDDIRVVGQAETYSQTLSAVKKFSSDILIFEAALAPNASDAVVEILRQTPTCKMVVVTETPDEELTLELFRRGAHGIVSREVEPEMLVQCLHKVAQGESFLETQAVNWVLQAFRTQATRPSGGRTKVQLTPKETLIVSCVTQGMKNKEIALRVGTTEQVVKNYLRKVYDKLGVADRLELALYCLHNRVLEGNKAAAPAASAEQAAAAGAGANGSAGSAPIIPPAPEKLS
jgi:two-component system, NarL family, nitrate/nitrite response regulator NarL